MSGEISKEEAAAAAAAAARYVCGLLPLYSMEPDHIVFGPRRDPDFLLPIANISRIMKRALPNNAKIAKDAKDAVQLCVTEFISFIVSE